MATYSNNRLKSTTVFGNFNNLNSSITTATAGAYFQGDVSINSILYCKDSIRINSGTGNEWFSATNTGDVILTNSLSIQTDTTGVDTTKSFNVDGAGNINGAGNMTIGGTIACSSSLTCGSITCSPVKCGIYRTNDGFSLTDMTTSGSYFFGLYNNSGLLKFGVANTTSELTTETFNINATLNVYSYNRSVNPITVNKNVFQVFTDGTTGANDKIYCNAPTSFSQGQLVSYTTFPSTITSNTNSIGYTKRTTLLNSSNVAITSSSITNISSIQLPAGVWFVSYQVQIGANSTLSFNSVKLNISRVTNTFSIANTFQETCFTRTVSTTQLACFQGFKTINSANETFYLNVALVSTGAYDFFSSNDSNNFISATRIA